MTTRNLGALALGDFRDRVRRPAYAVTLLAAVGLGYLAVPPVHGHWTIMDVGGYRGTYNSAYVGMATALAGALWLTFGGFYVVRNTIARDVSTRVGQILATTPLRTAGYLAGKFLSNFMVLASMAGVLAVTALIMQLGRGESTNVDLIALWMPFLLFTLPPLAVIAAAGVLFETTPLLRSGFGNVIWFAVAMIVAIGGQSANAPLGGLGVHPAVASMRDALIGQHHKPGEFSLGLTYQDHPLRTFDWHGLTVTAGVTADRLVMLLLGAALAMLPALWFNRFDPSRGGRAFSQSQTTPTSAEPAGFDTSSATPSVRRGLPRSVPQLGNPFGRLLAGEFRILVQGVSWWWWLIAVTLTITSLAAPMGVVTAVLLPVAWIWPVLIWSRLGTQEVEYDLENLLRGYPTARRRLLAQWSAGVALTALTGAAPVLRMAVTAGWAGVAHWTAAILLIPSFALAVGVVSRTHRLFQAIYLPIWYLVINGVAAADFMGAVRHHGHPAGPAAIAVAGIALALLAIALLTDKARKLT